MKLIYYLCISILYIATNTMCWWGGSEYMPSYEGRAGAGYITPSRFAPIGYTKNTGWDSGDENCYQIIEDTREVIPVRVTPAGTRVHIIQKE